MTVVDDHAMSSNLDLDAWPGIACRVAGRNLTAAEWEQYGPRDTPRQATCPDWELPG